MVVWSLDGTIEVLGVETQPKCAVALCYADQ